MRYVYARITDKCLRTMEETKKKRKYQKVEEISSALGVKNIKIDICSSYNRKKPELDKITSKKGNVIIVPDISCLGAKNEIASVYEQIIKSENDILIAYYDTSGQIVANELSSVGLDFDKVRGFSLEKNLEKIGGLSAHEIIVESWKQIDPALIDAYWAIEKQETTLKEAVEKIGISKHTFGRRIKEYVGSPAWQQAVLSMQMDLKSHPTTLGDISENGIKMYNYLQNNPNDIETYGLSITASFAGIEPELWEKTLYQEDETKKQEMERKNNSDIYEGIALWSYRESLRYDKYLKNLKYRKDKYVKDKK